MTAELQAISNIPGATALCLHRGAEVIHHNLPDTYGDAAATDLCHVVSGIFSAYSQVAQPVTQGYFQYPESGIPVIKSSPVKSTAAKECFLTFLVSDPRAIQTVLAPARAFLARQTRASFATARRHLIRPEIGTCLRQAKSAVNNFCSRPPVIGFGAAFRFKSRVTHPWPRYQAQ